MSEQPDENDKSRESSSTRFKRRKKKTDVEGEVEIVSIQNDFPLPPPFPEMIEDINNDENNSGIL
jgi:hypothetical protein